MPVYVTFASGNWVPLSITVTVPTTLALWLKNTPGATDGVVGPKPVPK